jgi:hypothetical protein
MTTKNIGDGRALRVCDLCGQVDDHPRHVIAGGDSGVFDAPSEEVMNAVIDSAPSEERGRLLKELLDTGSSDRHMDCCREAGCPTGTCDEQTAGAEDKRGADLLKHLTKEHQ